MVPGAALPLLEHGRVGGFCCWESDKQHQASTAPYLYYTHLHTDCTHACMRTLHYDNTIHYITSSKKIQDIALHDIHPSIHAYIQRYCAIPYNTKVTYVAVAYIHIVTSLLNITCSRDKTCQMHFSLHFVGNSLDSHPKRINLFHSYYEHILLPCKGQ